MSKKRVYRDGRFQQVDTQEKNNKKKAVKIILRIVLVILIIMLIGCSIMFGYIYSLLSKMNYVKLENIEINEGVEEQLKGYRNIALFGVDARANTYDNTRSDCIIIISINEDTKEVRMTSVYRDSYLYIDGHGFDKVTHAFAYGGPQLAVNTLNKNLDLNISDFVAVNFDAVVNIIDKIGGVNIEIEPEELNYINKYIAGVDQQMGRSTSRITRAGVQNLNGVQALAYSRIRYTAGGDYKRTERMRTVLNATFEKAKSLNVGQLNSLAHTLLPYVYTSISSTEVFSLIPSMTSYKVVNSEGWPYKVQGITLDRWYGVPVTLENNVKQLHATLFGNDGYEVSDKVKEYSNGIIKKTGYK